MAVGGGVRDKARSLVGKGKRKPTKSTCIVEDIDIGAPVSEVYNQWTQFTEFATFTEGVEAVEQEDDVHSTWHLKVARARRTMRTTIREQIPDRRIVWTSEGSKGSTDGVVTFHPLADDLTKVLVVLTYYPQGVVERLANLWRIAGRRTRLDLRHFRRFVSMRGEATGSWRGEIRDAEVMSSPEGEDEPDEDSYEDEFEEDADEESDVREGSHA